jgi:hypothetical protein
MTEQSTTQIAASPHASKTERQMNAYLSVTLPDTFRAALLDELHERALMEDQARAETPEGDEWMRGYLIAQMEWARRWPTDLR